MADHKVRIIKVDMRDARNYHFASIGCVVEIDGVECVVEMRCRRTGRQVNMIDHKRPAYQVCWSLKFENPAIRKHPDYKEIRKQICSELRVSTVNFNVRTTNDGKQIPLRSGQPI